MSMQSHQLPDIEPLSDLSWRRIEDQLFERMDAEASEVESPAARRFDRRWFAAGGLLAAAAAVVLFVVIRGGGAAGDSARTSHVAATDAASQVTLGDVSLTVQPHSAVLVTERESSTDIVLERGAVRCAVAPQRDGKVRVFAGEVTVEVVGTIFSVSRAGDTAAVEVERGVVEVVFRGDRTQVTAGDRWDGPGADHPDGMAMDPDVISRRKTRRKATKKKRRSSAKRPKSEAKPLTAEDKPTAKARYTAAAALESTAPNDAIAAYEALVREGGAWAAPALYATGRLQTELGRTTAARKSLERYLTRYPSGANAADARALLAKMR